MSWQQDLAPILGAVGGLRGRGGNAFMQRWQELEAQKRQRQQQDQQGAIQQEQLGFQRDANTRANAADVRAGEAQRMQYGQQIRQLFADPDVDPDMALQLATLAPPSGFDVGAVQALHSQIFTPSEKQAREARKRLKEIETDPQVKKLIESGEDLSTVTFEVPKLGPNPKNPEGKALWTRAELQEVAMATRAAAPLPKTTPASLVPNTPEEQFYQRFAQERGAASYGALPTAMQAEARKTWMQSDDRPGDPQLAEINRQLAQGRLDAQRTASASAPALPPATQRRVDAKAKAFDSQPVVKRIQTMGESVTFAEGLNVNTKNPADDQALIYAFAKAMDPDSVVREGEYATVQKYAQSWAERFGFEAARMFSNTVFLTAEARANMKATIRSRFAAAKPQYENLRRSYTKQINQITQGGDGDTYLIDYAAGFPGDPAQQPMPNPFRK